MIKFLATCIFICLCIFNIDAILANLNLTSGKAVSIGVIGFFVLLFLLIARSAFSSHSDVGSLYRSNNQGAYRRY